MGREQGLHFGVMPCDHVCAGYADENDAKNEIRLRGSFENQVPMVQLVVLGNANHPDRCHCNHRVHARGVSH